MNYLAHIYLSENDQLIALGNFMADEIKGRTYDIYNARIKVGILLHRQIDSFTDHDETARISKRRLNERYGHYSGIIIDILYDHFLARNWHLYSEIPLEKFVSDFYRFLEERYKILPNRIQHLAPYMIKDNWLVNYANFEGIEKVLTGMNKRTKMRSHMDLAINDLKENYSELENDFFIFFDKLKIFSHQTLIELKKKYKIL
jgi:acyl carrier protein phosphodiesterase